MKFSLPKKYYVISTFNKKIEKNLKKHKNIGVIFRPKNPKDIIYLRKIIQVNLYNKVFIGNEFKKIINQRIFGLYLSRFNKIIMNNRYNCGFNYPIIGSARCLRDIFQKIRSNCDIIFLSNVYKTSSHPENKNQLGLIRYLLIKRLFINQKIYAMGGMSSKKMSYNVLKDCGFAGISYFEK